MKKKIVIVIALLVSVFTGCSELSENLNPVKSPGIHGSGVNDTASASFHGLLKGASFSDCQRCHSSNFQGGTANVSCVKCHPSITVHKKDLLVPTSADFHGKYIMANNWNMVDCRNCHGIAYAGGRNNKSCVNSGCHTAQNGPENCMLCHGSGTNPAPPKAINGDTATTSRGVGAHTAHLLTAANSVAVSCVTCHTVPAKFDAAGHVGDGDNRAELIFGDAAKVRTNTVGSRTYTSTMPTITPVPGYNPTTNTCSNNYCHGNFKNGNTTNTISWNTGVKLQCGTCHGDGAKNPLPKTAALGGNHPAIQNCSFCHADVVSVTVSGTDTTYRIIDKSKHINGKLNLGGEVYDPY